MLSTALLEPNGSQWTRLPWKRRLELLGPNDGPVNPETATGGKSNICAIGELTDVGRQSMLQLGQRIRHLYVDQLKFMPKTVSEPDGLYLRASPYSRALESTHHAFLGLYPLRWRARAYVPQMVVRSFQDETLLPNETYCLRFIQMMKAYSQRSADRWNKTREMDFLNDRLRRHMPSEQRVAVDSEPRISGIYDASNSTLGAKDPNIRLPAEFYDPTVRSILDKIAFEEEFVPFQENKEYRTLGIGALLGDIVERMTQCIDAPQSEQLIRMTFSGGHDSTIMGILGSYGALEGKHRVWPPYSSSVAVELFRDKRETSEKGPITSEASIREELTIGRTSTTELSAAQRQSMEGYFVRMRYNDRPLTLPGCRAVRKHLEGDESFCTLAAFKEIADRITPTDIKKSCQSNLDKAPIPKQYEPAGY